MSIINSVLTKFMGTKHERDMKRMEPMVQAINALEPEISALTDDQLIGKTAEFRTGWRMASRWTTCSSRPSPWSARRAGACSTCATSTCS